MKYLKKIYEKIFGKIFIKIFVKPKNKITFESETLKLNNMNKFSQEQLAYGRSRVHTTTDYSLFSPIDGNRKVNQVHMKRLMKSMSENYLFSPIVVNELGEIIDGSHRFNVVKTLNLPLHYIICEGYRLHEVHILNQNSKTWTPDDFLDGYCSLGFEDYLKFAEFKLKYKFGHLQSLSLLSSKIDSNYSSSKAFSAGIYKIENYDYACDVAEKILSLKEFYKGIKRKSFVFAIINLLRNKNFDFDEFVQKLKLQQTSLVDCSNQTQYISLIEDIYNFRRRDKVNLRY